MTGKKAADAFLEGYRKGLAAGYLRAAQIADGHRAMNLNSGHSVSGVACSAVAAFIIQAAREAGVWDETLPVPLIRADTDGAA